jgi:hypothetical protein
MIMFVIVLLSAAAGAFVAIFAMWMEYTQIKILLHMHLNEWCKAETESGDIKHQYHQGSDALEQFLWAIENKEHRR